MFINTYNGRLFPEQWVRERLAGEGLQATELIALSSDTALIIASTEAPALDRLCLDGTARLVGKIRALGFRRVKPIPAAEVQVADWTDLRCAYGCSQYGHPHCPPDSPDADKTRKVLQGFRNALLLEGEPPTRDFQQRVLLAEKEAFGAGYYKAFAYWAGPCSLCAVCPPDGCRNRRETRPSMEAAGIDVFATVRRAGLLLGTLGEERTYAKYFALLLLE
jgi:predicted metal-binding protein